MLRIVNRINSHLLALHAKERFVNMEGGTTNKMPVITATFLLKNLYKNRKSEISMAKLKNRGISLSVR